MPISNRTNGKGYRWLFFGLVVILLVVFLVAFLRARKEGFENGAATLMYFFMPECGHCKKFTPEWEKLQTKVDTDRAPVRLSKIDGTQDANKEVVNQYNVRGFPTVILEKGDESHVYDGERTADAVYSWMMKIVEGKADAKADAKAEAKSA